MEAIEDYVRDFSKPIGVSTAEGYSTSYAQSIKGFLDEKFSDLESLGYKKSEDSYGNMYVTREVDADAPWVVLDAHMDEIGFIVSKVYDDKLQLESRGFIDCDTALDSSVDIYSEPEKKHGAITVGKAGIAHVEYFVEMDNTSGIKPGDVVLPSIRTMQRGGKLYARNLDDRIGLALAYRLAQKAGDLDNVNIMLRATVEEESYLAGATNAEYSEKMKENGIFVIALDVHNEKYFGKGALVADEYGMGPNIDETSKHIASDAMKRTGVGTCVRFAGGSDLSLDRIKDSFDEKQSIYGITLGPSIKNLHNGLDMNKRFASEQVKIKDIEETETLAYDIISHISEYQQLLQEQLDYSEDFSQKMDYVVEAQLEIEMQNEEIALRRDTFSS